MKKIIHLISSPRGTDSLSIKLGNTIVEKIQSKYPDSVVTERNLVNEQIPHITGEHLGAFFTPEENRTARQLDIARLSDETINSLKEADIIVIGAPMYNFSVHSSLKAWIDHVVRAGQTFSYGENGPQGLVSGKKIYIAMTSGGVYSSGPAAGYDFVVPYLKSVLGFIGLTDVSVFRIEGVKLPGNELTAIEKGIESILID